MNNSSRMYVPAHNQEEEPPAYDTYGDTYFNEHDSPPAAGRMHGATMRLLPTSTTVESDLSADTGASSEYHYGDPYVDDGDYGFWHSDDSVWYLPHGAELHTITPLVDMVNAVKTTVWGKLKPGY
ncbi:chitin synthase, class 2 [Aspergillus brasiliensis]|uniref:Uncharacterized protein n=1 Tax=Aspergillus brasiliensis (strain CBS 101740 / IMI 381727 / IBT 21946) TaxID=767769 RepID=A0A1L9UYM5_ASPBC|nr:hypothetical protein ASPBRDRAFT_201900 [Aspergillus brasiliensis CBS 101740]GKZ44296.1 chitin synthase, class 2 [Aspergillus brasiliensis]